MRALGDVRPGFASHDQRHILLVNSKSARQRTHAFATHLNSTSDYPHIISGDLRVAVPLTTSASYIVVWANYGSGDGRFWVPPAFEPSSESCGANRAAGVAPPLGQDLPCAECFYVAVGAQIRSLLTVRCPTAIFRRVVAVGINAIKCQILAVTGSQCPLAKCAETSCPLGAHRDTTAAIARKGDVPRICAASNHAHPDVVYPVVRACQMGLPSRVNGTTPRAVHFAGEVA